MNACHAIAALTHRICHAPRASCSQKLREWQTNRSQFAQKSPEERSWLWPISLSFNSNYIFQVRTLQVVKVFAVSSVVLGGACFVNQHVKRLGVLP